MTLVALGSLASALDDQPWLMPRACTAGERSPARVIERHLRRAACAKTVVVATPAGSFGNVLSTVTHAFLRALIIGSQLVVSSGPSNGSTLQYLAPSPLWTLADSEALRRLSSANVSLLRVPRENFLPLSPCDHSLWQQLSHVTHISALVSCVSHVLFQPGPAVVRAMASYLQEFDAADNVVGLHLRTTDREMAARQNVTARRLSLDLGIRRGRATGRTLIDQAVSCTLSIMDGAARKNVTLFVGTDLSSVLQPMQSALGRHGGVERGLYEWSSVEAKHVWGGECAVRGGGLA